MYEHIVLNQDLLARRQLLEALDDTHTLDKVDIGAHGYAHVDLTHTVGAVGQDVKASGKAEVLRVVGGEVHTYTLVLAFYHEGIDNKVTIKADACMRSDGTGKGIL